MNYYDIEYIIIYFVLFLLFILSLSPQRPDYAHPLLCIDLEMSKAIKGIACIMILTAHWGQRRLSGVDDIGYVSKVVWSMAASIGLVWFMFFSGYGLSLKKMNNNDLLPGWIKSLMNKESFV